MPITRDLLVQGEDVLVDVRPHWLFLLGPLSLALAGLALAVGAAVQFPDAPAAVSWVLVAVVLVPVAWLAARLARWSGMSFAVTTQRILVRRGFLRRDVVQLRLEHVAEVRRIQRPIERLVRVGRLAIEMRGDRRVLLIEHVRRPKSLQRVLTRQLSEVASSSASGPADTPVGGFRPGYSVPQQLIELDELRRRGIVTTAEFEAKKAELLGRL